MNTWVSEKNKTEKNSFDNKFGFYKNTDKLTMCFVGQFVREAKQHNWSWEASKVAFL